MRITTAFVIACQALMLANLGSAQQPATGPALDVIPKALEAKLALSALPPYLRSEATVYVLDLAKGYILERKGSNDFTCFVEPKLCIDLASSEVQARIPASSVFSLQCVLRR